VESAVLLDGSGGALPRGAVIRVVRHRLEAA
jgi:hypothetical protein